MNSRGRESITEMLRNSTREAGATSAQDDLAATLRTIQGRHDAAVGQNAPAPRSRRYEQENPAFSYRTRPEDDQRLRQIAEELGTTKDAVARAFMEAILDAYECGAVTLDVSYVTTVKRDALNRLRPSVTYDIAWVWQPQRLCTQE